MSVPEFTAVQISLGSSIAYSGARRRIGVYASTLRGRRNFPLAKVGVEGSNPFARSSFWHFPHEPRDPFVLRISSALSVLLAGSSVWSFRTSNVVFFLAVHPRHQDMPIEEDIAHLEPLGIRLCRHAKAEADTQIISARRFEPRL